MPDGFSFSDAQAPEAPSDAQPSQIAAPDMDAVAAKSGLPRPVFDRAMAVYMGRRDRGDDYSTALGWTGNAVLESGANPYSQRSPTGAAGTFQWVGPRLKAYNDRYGHDPDHPDADLDENLDFVDHENAGPEKENWARIQAAPPDGVLKSKLIRTYWERPGRSPEEVAAEEEKVGAITQKLAAGAAAIDQFRASMGMSKAEAAPAPSNAGFSFDDAKTPPKAGFSFQDAITPAAPTEGTARMAKRANGDTRAWVDAMPDRSAEMAGIPPYEGPGMPPIAPAIAPPAQSTAQSTAQLSAPSLTEYGPSATTEAPPQTETWKWGLPGHENEPMTVNAPANAETPSAERPWDNYDETAAGRAATLRNIVEAVKQGWEETPPILSPKAEEYLRSKGATPDMIGFINSPSYALGLLNAAFKGGQQAAQEVLTPIIGEQGARDLAAMPEAFMGGPHLTSGMSLGDRLSLSRAYQQTSGKLAPAMEEYLRSGPPGEAEDAGIAERQRREQDAADVEAAMRARQPGQLALPNPEGAAPNTAPATEAARAPEVQGSPIPPTTPEPPGDVHAQLQALVDPNNPKDAVFLAKGTELPPKPPEGVHAITRMEGTLYSTDPAKIRAFMSPDLTDEGLAKILGYPEPKADAIASGSPAVVEAKDAAGNVVASAAASPEAVTKTEDALAPQTPPGGSVEVTSPVKAQTARAARAQAPTPYLDVPKEPQRLIPFLQQGITINPGQPNERIGKFGVKDPGGDIASIIGGQKGRPGLINNLNGENLDEAGERAWQAGYFDHRPDLNELRAAIEEDQNGNPVYSARDLNDAQAYSQAQAHNAEIDRLSNDYGIPTKGLTREQFFDRLTDQVSQEEALQLHNQAIAEHQDAYQKAIAQAKAQGVNPEAYQPRSLEEMEDEHRQADAAAATAGGGPNGEGQPVVNPDAGAGPPGAGQGGRGAVAPQVNPAPVNLFGDLIPPPKAGTIPPATIRTDPNQIQMPGMAPSAVQAQAAADAKGRGGLQPTTDQEKANEGLFAPPPVEQPSLPTAQVPDHEAWWDKSLTTEGRKRVMDAAGLKRVPRIKWKYLNEAEREKLLANRAAAEDRPAEVKPAPTDLGPHHAAGVAAFLRGDPRTLPGYFTGPSHNSRAWLKGWDQAKKETAEVKPLETPASHGAGSPAVKPESGWVHIGINKDGHPLFARSDGVRSYVESGIRHTEPVQMRPTPNGVQPSVPVAADKPSDFKVATPNHLSKVEYSVPEPEPVENKAPEKPTTEPKQEQTGEQPGYGANNKTFTADAAARARARLKDKLNRFTAGFDPEMMLDGLTLAGFHIEAGARRFGAYARAMIGDLGEGIRPYLAHFYNSVRDYPGFDNAGMDHANVVRDIDLNDPRLSPKVEAEAENGIQGPVPGRDDLTGPEAVHGPAQGGEARPASAGEVAPGAPNAEGPAGEGAKGSGRLAEEPERGTDGGGNRPGDTDRLPGPPAEPEPGAAGRPAEPDAWVVGTNFRIEPGAVAEERGPVTKARDNVAAVELAKTLTADNRPASKAEQAILAKYVGWGGLSGAFPNPATGKFGKGLEKVGARLKELLTPEEYEAAASSTQFAHYTAEHVIRSMWDAVERMGFKGGSVFEPGMGVGHFLGMMPADLAGRSTYQGIERDNLTAQIAKLLYPESGVRQADFIETPMPEDHFDLAIGNPPFSDTVIKADPKYAARNFMLHDYFFARSLDSVRPGGLMAFVTSAGTMNKIDPNARQYLAQRAEFAGGIRLPSSAFRKNAGTDVTTDVLFFKKRPETVALNSAEIGDHGAWTSVVQRTLPDVEGKPTEGNVSRWFSDHPEMVLGNEGYFDKLYKGRYAVHAPAGQDLPAALREAVQRLPENIMEAPPTPMQRAALDFASGQKKEGSFYLGPQKTLMQYRSGAGQAVPKHGVAGGMTAENMDRVAHLVPVRDALRDVFRADLTENAEDAAAARAALNKHYDAFVKKFGPINKAEFSFRRPTVVQMERARLEAREEARDLGHAWEDGDFDPGPMLIEGKTVTEIAKARSVAREAKGESFDEGTFSPQDMPDIKLEKRPNIAPFMSDPESYRLRSIERYDDETGEATKKRIFHESVLTREQEPQINSANDGLLWSLNKFGRMDLDEIAAKMNRPRADVIAELGNAIFQPPNGDWQSASEYLSGDVVAKLAEARTAMATDREMERNVRALEEALPRPLPPSDISMNLGMPWLPRSVMEDFAANHLRLGNIEIVHIPSLGTWKVSENGRSGDRSGIETYATSRREAKELLSDALNRTPPRIYDRMRDGSSVFNVVATQEAQEKMDLIKSEFRDWIEADNDRLNSLAQTYNDALNRTVLRKYDGGYLTTPGISSEWRWRPHQTRVVARIIQSGSTYMAHAVGAGKTSAMIGAGMEMRRLGLVKKPMYAVPNHMLGQFTKEFYEQYPTARISVADEERFHTDTRRQFMSDVAQDDLDAVIITHSSFGKIPISDDFQKTLVQEELDRIATAMEDLDPQSDRVTIKALKNAQDKMKQKLAKAGTSSKDLTNTFEEMGVDFLFVDEAHNFRKLSIATKQGNLKGITTQGSGMAWDLYTKLRYLDEQNPGRAAVLASGTPVTNTMGELYTLSRFLQRPALDQRGISHFDSWSQMFGDTKTDLEAMPDGSFKPVTRFARFVNMPELYKMVGEVMDVVTPNQLAQYVTRPKLQDGERKLHIAPFTPALQDYQGTLAARMQEIALRKGPSEKGDDILLNVINDGRHAAIDPRFVMRGPPDPKSKLNMMIDNVHRIWKETKNQQFYQPRDNYADKAHKGPATQMIFMNMGVNGRGPMGFSGYGWIRSQLRAKGIPANEIAIIGDYKGSVARQALFNDMNEGKVRVLLGSVQKMGTGVNAQRLLIALHNQDPLWYPADDEQRVGRMLRQGNMNPLVQVHDYTTMDTYDRTMWAMMGRKGRFIEQFFRGDPDLRDMDDLGEAGMFEQASAMATSDPRVFRLTELKQALQTAERRASAYDRRQYDLTQRKAQAERWARHYTNLIEADERDLEQRRETKGDAFSMRVGEKTYTKRKDAAQALTRDMNDAVNGLGPDKGMTIGELGGFPVVAVKGKKLTSPVDFFLQLNNNRELEINGGIHDPDWSAGFIRSAEAKLGTIDDNHASDQRSLREVQQSIPRMETALSEPFTGMADIQRLRAETRQLEAEMAPKKEAPPSGDIQTSIPKGWDAAETETGLPTQEAVQAAANAVAKMLGGKVRVAVVNGGLRVKIPGVPHADIGGYAVGRLIRVAMDQQTLANLDHEAIHALRNMGVFTPAEWKALEDAARKEGWLDRHDVPSRYGHLPEPKQIEEAIAEEFAKPTRPSPSFGLVARLMAKLRQWLNRLRTLLGRDKIHTVDDVFGSVRSGEVGAREPGSGMAERGPTSIQESVQRARAFHPDDVSFALRPGRRLNLTGSRGEVVKQKRGLDRIQAEVKSALSPTSLHNAKPVERLLRQHGAVQAQSYAQAAHALESARDALNKLPKDEQIAFTDNMEKGLPQADPGLDAVATTLRGVLDGWTRKVQSLGRDYLENARENYMGHIYSNYQEWSQNQTPPSASTVEDRRRMAMQAKRPIQGSKNFLKKRTFETQKEAIDAGLIPVTYNPIDLQLMKIREMQKFYHGTRLADTMKNSGIAVWVPTGQEGAAAQEGLLKLDDRVFQPRLAGPANPAGFGRLEPGNWYAPEAMGRLFNRYVSQGLSGQSVIYDAIRTAGNALNSLQLGLSGFHAAFVTMDTAISRAALGLHQVMHGDIKGTGNMAMGAIPGLSLASVVNSVRDGSKLRNAWLDPQGATLEWQRLAERLNEGGGRVAMDQFYRNSSAGTFFEHLSDLKNPLSPLHQAAQMWRDAPEWRSRVMLPLRLVGRTLDTIMHPLMGHLVPRAKLGVFSEMARDWQDKHPNATDEERSDAMIKAWDSVENRLGQMTYDNVFWHKALKDTAFITTRSVGWNLGTWRELGGGVVDTAAMLNDIAHLRKPDFTYRMAYSVMLPIVTATLGAMLTYWFTGKPPQSLLDYFYPPTGQQDERGNDQRISIPGYMKDVVAFRHDWQSTITNKTHPLISMANQLRTNTDYYGHPIYSPGHDSSAAGAYLDYLLAQHTPFSFRAMQKMSENGAHPSDLALAFFGFQPAPQSIVNPERGEMFQHRQDARGFRAREKAGAFHFFNTPGGE